LFGSPADTSLMPMTYVPESGNRHQIPVPENWYQNLAPVFGTSC